MRSFCRPLAFQGLILETMISLPTSMLKSDAVLIPYSVMSEPPEGAEGFEIIYVIHTSVYAMFSVL